LRSASSWGKVSLGIVRLFIQLYLPIRSSMIRAWLFMRSFS
jgi:hypothetical protein